MPIFDITDPLTGKSVEIEGDSPPTEAELNEIFDHVNGQANQGMFANGPGNTTSPQQIEREGGIRGADGKLYEVDMETMVAGSGKSPVIGEQVQPGLREALFPRASSAADAGFTDQRYGTGLVADALSIPGRAIASVADRGFNNNRAPMAAQMADTQGDSMLGNIVRSPSTGAMAIAGAATGGLALPALAGAVATQTDDISQGKDFDPLKMAGETALNYAGGKVANAAMGAAGKAMGALKNKASTLLEGRAAEATKKLIKPTKSDIKHGFEEGTLKEFGITGNLEEAGATTKQLVETYRSKLQTALGKASDPTGSRASTVDALDIIAKARKTPGFAPEHRAVTDDLVKRLDDIAPNGILDVAQANEFNVKVIGGQRNFGGLQAKLPEEKKILGELYDSFRDEIRTKAEALGGDIAEANANLHKLYPVKEAIENKLAGIDETATGKGMLGKLGDTMKDATKGSMNTLLLETAGHFVGMPTGLISGGKIVYNLSGPVMDKISLKLMRDKAVGAMAQANNVPIQQAARAVLLARVSGMEVGEALRMTLEGSDGPENYIDQNAQKSTDGSRLFDVYGNVGQN